jgi:[ribosomal protein S5]-alanine N-acetyltransferase
MALRDQIRLILFLRWPALRNMRDRVRRLFPAIAGLRRLEMPIFETTRLKLRPVDQKDLQEIADWGEFTSTKDAVAVAQEFLDHCFREYRERGIGPWGIQLKETGALVGNCGFPDISFRQLYGEVNYYIAPQYRGRGLAAEAVMALFLAGFGEFGLARIQARCNSDNLSSQRVMQKLGMKFEGFVEASPSSNGTAPKQKLYSILKKDVALRTDGKPNISVRIGAPRSQRPEG